MSPETMACPACQRPRLRDATECAHCGVVFARYKPRANTEKSTASQVAVSPKVGASAPLFSRLSLRQLEGFLLAASESLAAGITAASFARGAGGAMLPPALGRRFVEIVESGGSVVALLEEVGLPGPGDVAILVAAEKRGELPKALGALAHGVEAQRKARTRFVSMLLYPAVLLAAWFLIEPLALLVLQGPGAYAGRVLPRLLPLLALVVAGPFFAFRINARSPLRRLSSAPLAVLPPFAGIAERRAKAAFADVLGSCLRAGLPLYEALELAGGGASHPVFSRQIGKVREAIAGGARLYVALEALPFLREEKAWIQHGEESGHLDAALSRLADRNREQAQLRTRVLFLVAAMIFGVFVLARLLLGTIEAYQGYFKLLDGLIEPFLGGGVGRGIPE